MNTKTKINYAARAGNVPASFIREILKVASDPSIISFAGGLPNPSCFPLEELKACTETVFSKNGSAVLQYASTEGYALLREQIASRYWDRFRLKVDPAQILITHGSQQALDLLGKLFLDPGNTVLVERPCYLGALQCFAMYQASFAEVSLMNDGPDAEELSRKLDSERPKLFYSIPNFQNPSGISWSAEKREKLTEILSPHDTIIIEDDPYGEISFENETRMPLYSFLPDKTILLGSFSKIIAPGLRLGWMLASEKIIKKAAILKQASDLHSSNLSQHIIAEYLSNYKLDAHLNKLKKVYKRQRDVMMDCLDRHFPSNLKFTRPEGGMFVWMELHKELRSAELLSRAIKEGILFVPGDSFYAHKPNLHTLRLNYSNADVKEMKEAMEKLAKLVAV